MRLARLQDLVGVGRLTGHEAVALSGETLALGRAPPRVVRLSTVPDLDEAILGRVDQAAQEHLGRLPRPAAQGLALAIPLGRLGLPTGKGMDLPDQDER